MAGDDATKKETLISKLTAKPADVKRGLEIAAGVGQPATLHGVPLDQAKADAFRRRVAGAGASYVDTASKAVVDQATSRPLRTMVDNATDYIGGERYMGTTAAPTPVAGQPGVVSEPSAKYIPAQSSEEKAAAVSAPKEPEVDPAAAAQEMAMREMAKQQAAQQAASAAQSASANKALNEAGKSYVAALTAENMAALKMNEQHAASADAMVAEHRARQVFFENERVKEESALAVTRARQEEAIQKYQERSEMAWKQMQAVSPDKYWKDKGPIASMGIILGGIGAAFGSPATSQAYLNRLHGKIEENVQLQTQAANATGKYTNEQMNTYQMMRQQGADDAQARAIAREVGYKQVMAHMDEVASRSGSKEIMAKSDAIKADLQKQLAVMQMQAAQKAAAMAAAAAAAPKDMSREDLSGIAKLEKEVGTTGDVGSLDRLESMVDAQLKKDPKSPVTGTGAWAGIKADLPLNIGKKYMMDETEQSNRAQFDMATQRILHEMSGAGVSDKERSSWEKRLMNASTAVEQKAVITEMADVMRSKRASVQGAVPEAKMAEYERRQRLAAARGKLDKK